MDEERDPCILYIVIHRLMLVLLLSGGCLGGASSTCQAGSEACACYGNSTCDPGLRCLSKLCVLDLGDVDAGIDSRFGSGGSAAVDGSSGGAGGGGGSIGSGGAGGGGAGGAAPLGCATPEVVDDLEDGDAAICPGRAGGWYVTANGSTTTPGAGTVIAPVRITDRPGSSYAMSLAAEGLDGPDDYAYLGVSVSASGGLDASRYSGLRFWGRSTGAGAPVIRVSFPTVASATVENGGVCVPTTLFCGDSYNARRTFTGAWQQFDVYFANGIRQEGWGVPVVKDLAHLLVIQFELYAADNAGQDTFGIMVDDVTFY